ncbi:hypothetical protein MTO96_041703 [Rhipicephalus appendiculatus]
MQQNGDEDGIGRELKMAMAFSKLPEFAPGSGSFDILVERFELYSSVNEIADAKKLHLFLSTIGEEAYVTLRSLLLPKTPSTSSYQEVVSALKKHYSLRRSVPKKLPSLCDFGGFLEQALRDRLIEGLHSEAVRCRLLAMSDSEFTWDRACNTATAMEVAAKDVVKMVAKNIAEQSSSSTDIHWQSQSAASRWSSQSGACTGHGSGNTTKTSAKRTKTICHRCGGQHARRSSMELVTSM